MAAKARRLIASHLTDPSSLQLRDIRVVQAMVDGQKRPILCGEYNSRNKVGGYVGYTGFVYEPSVVKGVITMNADYFSADGTNDVIGDDLPSSDAGIKRVLAQAKIMGAQAKEHLPACVQAQ